MRIHLQETKEVLKHFPFSLFSLVIPPHGAPTFWKCSLFLPQPDTGFGLNGPHVSPGSVCYSEDKGTLQMHPVA